MKYKVSIVLKNIKYDKYKPKYYHGLEDSCVKIIPAFI